MPAATLRLPIQSAHYNTTLIYKKNQQTAFLMLFDINNGFSFDFGIGLCFRCGLCRRPRVALIRTGVRRHSVKLDAPA